MDINSMPQSLDEKKKMLEMMKNIPNNKFKLDAEDQIEVDGKKLYRIIYLNPIIVGQNILPPNSKGGYLEKEENLSKFDNSLVLTRAYVKDNAVVSGNCIIHGDVKISGSAKVSGYHNIGGKVSIKDDAKIYGAYEMKGNISIYGKTFLDGEGSLEGKIELNRVRGVNLILNSSLMDSSDKSIFIYEKNIGSVNLFQPSYNFHKQDEINHFEVKLIAKNKVLIFGGVFDLSEIMEGEELCESFKEEMTETYKVRDFIHLELALQQMIEMNKTLWLSLEEQIAFNRKRRVQIELEALEKSVK